MTAEENSPIEENSLVEESSPVEDHSYKILTVEPVYDGMICSIFFNTLKYNKLNYFF